MTLREFLFPSNPPTDVELSGLFILLIGPWKHHRWRISMWAKLICVVKLFCLLWKVFCFSFFPRSSFILLFFHFQLPSEFNFNYFSVISP